MTTIIPELGHFALILALSIALALSVLPLIGAARNDTALMGVARAAAWGQLVFVALAYAALTWSFVIHDFSVLYVSRHSNLTQPLMYRISGVWGSHEGSLLLWSLVLSLWTAAVALFSRALPMQMLSRVLAVMGMISVGFLLFMLLTSNPFERLFPAPLDGTTLNPLLQDPGLAIHPPMLYMGYVGFSVAFAFAIAALIGGRLDATWARWSRPWTTIAWSFLTFGIALGSWWAYNELGWGGWWFWDPVENASFMPWLVGTALIHSLATTEKRGVFKSWTVLLAILAFTLSLLGTFIVRSGVLISVHAFATDPARGLFILIFLAIVVGGSLLLYAWRAGAVSSSGHFGWFTRESMLLLNNVIFVTAAAAVLVGTLYPLFVDAFGLGKISVGRPYFDTVFGLITAPLLLLIGFGPMLRWKKDVLSRHKSKFIILLLVAVASGCLVPLIVDNILDWRAAPGLIAASWIAIATLYGLFKRLRASGRVPLSFLGMTLAHLGIAFFVAGVSITTIYSFEKDISLAPGSEYQLGEYTLYFEGMRRVTGPNYLADEAVIKLSKNGEALSVLAPQKRIYNDQDNPMTEASIDQGFMRDVYVALGDPLDAARDGSGAWSFRVYFKPLIRWIWLGALLMALGGVMAVSDRRYRRKVRAKSTVDKSNIDNNTEMASA